MGLGPWCLFPTCLGGWVPEQQVGYGSMCQACTPGVTPDPLPLESVCFLLLLPHRVHKLMIGACPATGWGSAWKKV